jgi:hypothetical protein
MIFPKITLLVFKSVIISLFIIFLEFIALPNIATNLFTNGDIQTAFTYQVYLSLAVTVALLIWGKQSGNKLISITGLTHLIWLLLVIFIFSLLQDFGNIMMA